MNTAWNLIKYPALALMIVYEFFIISAFCYTPIEIALMFWLATILIFEMLDQLFKETEEKHNGLF